MSCTGWTVQSREISVLLCAGSVKRRSYGQNVYPVPPFRCLLPSGTAYPRRIGFHVEKSAGTAGKLDAESGCSSRDQSETAHCVWLTGKLQVRNGRRCTVLPEIHKRGDGKSGFLSLVCNRVGDRNCV